MIGEQFRPLIKTEEKKINMILETIVILYFPNAECVYTWKILTNLLCLSIT